MAIVSLSSSTKPGLIDAKLKHLPYPVTTVDETSARRASFCAVILQNFSVARCSHSQRNIDSQTTMGW